MNDGWLMICCEFINWLPFGRQTWQWKYPQCGISELSMFDDAGRLSFLFF
jgi:hypothetical protein